MAELTIADGFFVYIRKVPKSHYSWIPITPQQYFENRLVIDSKFDVMCGHEWVAAE